MRRVLTVLLALGVAGGAADDAKTLNTARRLLLSGKVDDRLDAVRLLGSVDGEVSVHLLGSAVKRSLAAMDELARPFDQLDGDYQRARNRVRSAREKGKRALLRRRQKELDELDADWGRYRGQLRAHLRLVLEAAAILREFSSDAAVAALEDAARKGGHPVQRQVVVSALGRSGLERSVPLLLELLDVRDGRVRAHAVRALEPFVGVPGVIDRVVELIDDEGWPVRLGAYRVMVGAPMRVAVPFFVRAVRRERGEMALAVDNYLEALTGQSFAGRTLAWRQWWDENRRAFGLGAFRRVEKKALPKGAETRARFFSVPIESERLVFCIDLSASMEKKMALEDPVTNELLRTYALPATRLGYAKAELIRAVRELPDGARFNIIAFSDRARRFSGRLERVDRASRRRALDWILDQEVGDLTNIWESLHVAFNGFLGTTAGVQAFRDLPDTIVFLTDGRPTRGRFQGHRSLLDQVALWNDSLDVAIHCVGMGSGHDRRLLESLALGNHGYYVDLTRGRRVPDRRFRPVPESVQRLSFAHRVQEALAALRSDAAAERLGAVAELADCGRAARAATGDLVRALADPDERVREAANALLARFGKPSVPHLAEALGHRSEATAALAARALARIGPDAAEAVPALVRELEARRLTAVDCAAALGAIGSAARPALPALAALLDAKDLVLAAAARKAIQGIVGKG